MMVSINEMVWEQVLGQLTASEKLGPRTMSYLKDADCTLEGSSVMLAFKNNMSKENVDQSGAREMIREIMKNITGQESFVGTVVIPDEKPFAPKPEITPISTTEHVDGRADASPAPDDEGFNKKYVFDSFVVGESNRLAYGAAMSVAERPGEKFNPLFIYGKSGLGKTHLLCAIQNYLAASRPELKVLYFAAKDLVSDISERAIRKDWQELKYHTYDVLLIDDIQFLEGKKESTELVFQLLNDFITLKKQIVLSADRSPRELNMDERMTSRFLSGLSTDIQPPTFETKMGILRSYRDNYLDNKDIPFEVLEYIAQISSSNIREIEGALNKIDHYISLFGSSSNPVHMNAELAADILTGYFPESNAHKPSVKVVLREVGRYYHVSQDELTGPKREQRIAQPRHVAMYLCRLLTDVSFVNLGKEFGNRDHSSVMYAVEKIEKSMARDRSIYDDIQALKREIEGRA